MAVKIDIKHSNVAGVVPTTSSLNLGEIAINTYDGKVFIKKDNGTPSIIEIGSGSGGGGTTNPAGSNTQIQYNNNNSFGGVPVLTYDGTSLSATGSFTGSFTGSLQGTASWTTNFVSASNYVLNSQTSSFVLNSQTSSMTAGTSSLALRASGSLTGSLLGTAATASYVTASNVVGIVTSASFSSTSSYVVTASIASRATQVDVNGTGLGFSYYVTFVQGISSPQTVNFSNNGFTYKPSTDTLTVANISGTSSYASTASYISTLNQTLTISGSIIPAGPYTANTSSYNLGSPTAAWKDIYVSNGSMVFISGSTSSSIKLGTDGIVNLTGSLQGTSSWASNAVTSSATTAFDGSWTSYTPSWTAASSNPSIGNGSLQGWYKVVGKTCFVRGNIVMGSTTTFGSGEWYVSMPFTASHADAILMTANLLDNGTAWYNATVNGARAGFNYKSAIQYQVVGGTANDINATSPFTWTNSDRFLWNGSYEIA